MSGRLRSTGIKKELLAWKVTLLFGHQILRAQHMKLLLIGSIKYPSLAGKIKISSACEIARN